VLDLPAAGQSRPRVARENHVTLKSALSDRSPWGPLCVFRVVGKQGRLKICGWIAPQADLREFIIYYEGGGMLTQSRPISPAPISVITAPIVSGFGGADSPMCVDEFSCQAILCSISGGFQDIEFSARPPTTAYASGHVYSCDPALMLHGG
jgi:hypothetical protein